MRKLPESTLKYKNIFKKENVYAGFFNSVVPDMKLQEQEEYLMFRKEGHNRMFLVGRWEFSQK